MNRERVNLWVAKTVPLMIEIAKTVGAPPFPGRDAEIERIEQWIDDVAARITATTNHECSVPCGDCSDGCAAAKPHPNFDPFGA